LSALTQKLKKLAPKGSRKLCSAFPRPGAFERTPWSLQAPFQRLRSGQSVTSASPQFRSKFPMEANVRRKRIINSKYSRYACGTCRYVLNSTKSNLISRFLILSSIRKIKCDEGRDSCNNCTSTGRICDGYGVIISEDRSLPLRPLLPAPKALTNIDVSMRSLLLRRAGRR
ncbi:hypothetical protein KCU79_g173, partial [Aureobasidium melanogenum]